MLCILSDNFTAVATSLPSFKACTKNSLSSQSVKPEFTSWVSDCGLAVHHLFSLTLRILVGQRRSITTIASLTAKMVIPVMYRGPLYPNITNRVQRIGRLHRQGPSYRYKGCCTVSRYFMVSTAAAKGYVGVGMDERLIGNYIYTSESPRRFGSLEMYVNVHCTCNRRPKHTSQIVGARFLGYARQVLRYVYTLKGLRLESEVLSLYCTLKHCTN